MVPARSAPLKETACFIRVPCLQPPHCHPREIEDPVITGNEIGALQLPSGIPGPDLPLTQQTGTTTGILAGSVLS